MDLQSAQRRGGVGGEERVARAGGEDDHAALLEVAHRAAADVGLGHLLDVDRRHHPRVLADLLQRILQGERVQHRRQHSHVVAGCPVHAGCRTLQAAVDVAGADDDRHLHPALADGRDLARDPLDLGAVGAVIALPHQRLPRELQEDAAEFGLGLAQSPTRK